MTWPENADIAFAIRDDDVSAFTRPEMLEKVYRELWKKKFKVTIAAIPFHRAVNSLNIPPEFRGTLGYYPISINSKLIEYLKAKVLEGKVDIAQHGFSHSESLVSRQTKSNDRVERFPKAFSEFYGLNESECLRRIRSGRKLLEKTFARCIKIFVPPYEYLSKPLLSALKKENMFVCTSFNLKKIMFSSFRFVKPRRLLLAYFRKVRTGYWSMESLFEVTSPHLMTPTYRHSRSRYLTESSSSYWFTVFKEKFRKCLEERGFFIIVSHYWEYFYDWENEITQPLLLHYLHEIMELVDEYNVWKCSLTELSEFLTRK